MMQFWCILDASLRYRVCETKVRDMEKSTANLWQMSRGLAGYGK